jgi:hypothetical protein
MGKHSLQYLLKMRNQFFAGPLDRGREIFAMAEIRTADG